MPKSNLEITSEHVALEVLRALGHVLSPNHHAVLTLFYTNTRTRTTADVALATGLTPEMARVTLKRLVDRELLERVQRGVFQIPARFRDPQQLIQYYDILKEEQ